MRGFCQFCGEPVQWGQTAAFKVSGYEVERKQGGANAIKGRVREPDWIAHAVCVDAHLRRGPQEVLDV